MEARSYPWFDLLEGDDLQQGDILESCPVYQPPVELAAGESLSSIFDFEDRDIIVMTQTCDLVRGREKVSDAVCCLVWFLDEYTEGVLATAKGREDLQGGNLPSYHLLAACELPVAERHLRVVDFRQVVSLPLGFLRSRAALAEQRLRLLPPYREHLAQAFARYFMRIGLPLDIPPFR